MTMRRSDFKRQLQEGLNAVFGTAYREYMEEWRECFEINNSRKAYEEEVLEVGLGVAPERQEGDPVVYDDGGEGYRALYVNKEYALAFKITQQAIEDNLYGSKGPRYAKQLARAFKETREIVHANIFNRAFSASYTGGDGVALLSASHPQFIGGTWSNKLATPADPSESASEEMLIQIRKAKDDRGIPIALKPIALIAPPDQMFMWERILMSPNRVGTADNDINAMMKMGYFQQGIKVLTRLTDAYAWFVRTDCPDGLKHFTRVKLQRGMMGDFETDDMRYKARERYSAGWSDPRGLFGSEGASG